MLTKVRCALQGVSSPKMGSLVSSKVVSGSRKTESVLILRRGLVREVKKSGKAMSSVQGGFRGVRACVHAGCGGACVVPKQLVLGSRRYNTSASSPEGGAQGGGGGAQGGSAKGGPVRGGGVKKAGSTSSTLSNLEHLYAAFAKQQKEKAKAVETKEVAQEAPQRVMGGGAARSSAVGVPKDVHRQAAMELELAEGVEEDVPASIWSSSVFNRSGEENPEKLHRMMTKTPELVPRGTKGKDAHVENLESMAEMAEAFATKDEDRHDRHDVTRFAKEAMENYGQGRTAFPRAPRTIAELREFEEAESIAAGELDPTSPQALEMKKRHQRIEPRSESEAQAIEQNLIARHKSAVEQTTGHLIKELDLSASVAGMAPLTSAQNPYLFNEAFSVGLTDSELQWLQTRPAWQSHVDAKRTNLALQQRDMKQDSDLVDQLFINVVNRLSQGPQTGSWIHPDDIKAQQLAFEARKRLQARLFEIYNEHPLQWATLLHKYLPSQLEDRMASHILNREFWSPSNPWLITAFTKQLVEEAGYVNKMLDEDPIEDEIHERLLEQGALTEGDETSFVSRGPLGQKLDFRHDDDEVAAESSEGQEGFSGCLFCSTHRHRFPLDPMNVPLLARHLSSNGQILPRQATGLCKRHQAKMARTIKQARHLNLFTHKKSIYRINNVFKTPADWNTPDLDQQVYTNPLAKEVTDPAITEENEAADAYENSIGDSPLEFGDESPGLSLHLNSDEQIDALTDLEEEDSIEEIVEKFGVGRVSAPIMNSIETLAHRVTGTQTRSSEAEEALQAKLKISAAEAHDAESKLAASRRKSRSFVDDTVDNEEDDAIGQSMIKSALSKAKSRRLPKDSL